MESEMTGRWIEGGHRDSWRDDIMDTLVSTSVLLQHCKEFQQPGGAQETRRMPCQHLEFNLLELTPDL